MIMRAWTVTFSVVLLVSRLARSFTINVNQAQIWPKGYSTKSYICYGLTTKRLGHDLSVSDSYDGVGVLKQLGVEKRLIVLDSTNLPIPAEFYAQGKWGLCLIVGFKNLDTASKPLVEIIAFNATDITSKQTVDIGQITTVWDPAVHAFEYKSSIDSYLIHLQKFYSQALSFLEMKFPLNHFEASMEKLYLNHRKTSGRQRNKHTITSQKHVNHPLRDIIRNIDKAGPAMSRLIDSDGAIDYIFHGIPSSRDVDMDVKRIVSAEAIHRDFVLGGRFRRFQSIFVQKQEGHSTDRNNLHNITNALNMDTSLGVVIVNGGWLGVDSSSRAIVEGQKFAQRIYVNNMNNASHELTTADERILYRLESLAMGEDVDLSTTGAQNKACQLEIDVRQTLSSLNLPSTPEGARMALVQIGKWSESKVTDSIRALSMPNMTVLNPWSRDILSAAKQLATLEKIKRKELLTESESKPFQGSTSQWCGRSDLTLLPVVCIDAQRTTFRDDAISLRPRSKTGRKVINECEWEVLIHIADISDIYCPNLQRVADFSILRKAAKSRCMSRYDLPIGPLHLMPPQALEALSFECKKRDNQEKSSLNTCVTVWVYLDEESGRILDSGVERTVIACPTSLTFDGATQLLEDDIENGNGLSFQRSTQVLKIAERLLSRWNLNQVQTNIFAKKRDERLEARQRVAESMLGEEEMTDDGSQGSFRRSRGHRIVDCALDLYSYVISYHLVRAKVPFPRLAENTVSRRGRIGTAPLRRYIDGLVQRQVLAAICNYGGPIMNRDECSSAGKAASDVVNKIRNIASEKGRNAITRKDEAYYDGLKILENHMHRNRSNTVPGVCTGKENEVVILGSRLKAKCDGVRGTLRPGARILVQITKLDSVKGLLRIHLHEQ